LYVDTSKKFATSANIQAQYYQQKMKKILMDRKLI